MAEYIEREAAYQKACKGCTKQGDEVGSCRSGEPCYRLLYYFVTAPAADAAPVVHGEWVVCGDGDNVPWMCSHCGKTTAHKYKVMYGNYCPNCGAKMDAEVSDHA